MADPSKEQIKAWRAARVLNYENTRSPHALACMLVELEDQQGLIPEFAIDDEWPNAVRSLRIK
jgi:hypothetical protein